MTKWEYQVLRLQGKSPGLDEQIGEQLNRQGGMGWELVTILPVAIRKEPTRFAIFKKPLES